MEENSTTASEAGDPPLVDEIQPAEVLIKPQIVEPIKIKQENGDVLINDSSSKDESGIVMECVENGKEVAVEAKGAFAENDINEVNDDARSLGDLDSLPVGDEMNMGAAGSDSGVEGCGRALSSGGGSRSCASSVVSCGSGCGSESSSLAGAPPRPRRKVSVTVAEPKRSSPIGSSTPRPVTAPRGPNLATRERARSREKPALPEKPRPLTPKPRIRPSTDLPNLVRESPALRAKPTKTSTARCRTPSSPSEEKRWPSNGPRLASVSDASATRVAADKYGTLPRRRRDVEPEGSPKHDSMPPTVRRPTVTRSMSSRAPTKTRVRIYAEKVSQTVLIGTDIEAALSGLVPNIESRVSVSMCHRGVQASSRDAELSRLMAAAAAANATAAEERAHRLQTDKQLEEERAARQAAVAQLEANSQKLLELAGAGADANAEGCLRALEVQLRASSELAAKQRAEIDSLRAHADNMQKEAYSSRAEARALSVRLEEAEREAAEMQDFLAAETGALSDSLREAEADVHRLNELLERSRAECRQLVRMCELRRQESLCAAARARAATAANAGNHVAGAHRALHALAGRLHALARAVRKAYALPNDVDAVSVYHNMAFSRSDSGEQLSQEEPRGLVAAIARALRSGPQQHTAPSVPPVGTPLGAAVPPVGTPLGAAVPPVGTPLGAAVPPAVSTPHSVPYAPEDDRSRVSDDNDNSADLLDSETEPCLVTDPDCAEEWWSGAEGAGAWSGEELSPERESYGDIDKEVSCVSSGSDRESLRNLSLAIAQRQRSEAEDIDRGTLLDRVVAVDDRLTDLLRVLRQAANVSANDADDTRLANALRDKLEMTEKNVTDVVVKKLAELDASKNMMNHYHNSVEAIKKQQSSQSVEDEELQKIEEELSSCGDEERRSLYLALDAASGALATARRRPWPRLDSLALALERLAFVLAAPTTHTPHTPHPHTAPPHTPARMHVQSTA